jgi:hypothetical protein
MVIVKHRVRSRGSGIATPPAVVLGLRAQHQHQEPSRRLIERVRGPCGEEAAVGCDGAGLVSREPDLDTWQQLENFVKGPSASSAVRPG